MSNEHIYTYTCMFDDSPESRWQQTYSVLAQSQKEADIFLEHSLLKENILSKCVKKHMIHDLDVTKCERIIGTSSYMRLNPIQKKEEKKRIITRIQPEKRTYPPQIKSKGEL